ncbi:hypothetical protein BRC75_03780, partial [Halobacteriales archaeon QH_7_69_31]
IYTAYEVDRTRDSADTPKRVLRSYRVPEGEVELQELQGSQTDVTSARPNGADGPPSTGRETDTPTGTTTSTSGEGTDD